MSQGNADHQLGELSARVRILEESQLRLERRIEDRLEDLANKVDTIHEAMIAAKGSWRTLIALGAIVSGCIAVAGFVVKLVMGR
jgi:hypothetical protein